MEKMKATVFHGTNNIPFPLEKINDAYDLFGARRDGVLKVAIKPSNILPCDSGA